MKLSILIPVYNEERTIKTVLKKISDLRISGWSKEIVVIDDGSKDNSKKIIKEFQSKSIKLIEHSKNMGKGEAVKSGIDQASGEYILIQDADLEYSPNDISKLLDPIERKRTKVVYGTRLRRLPDFTRDERSARFFIHYLGNRFLSILTSLLYGTWITDMETGYKLFPREAVKDMIIHAQSFDFEPEITAKLLKKGFSILEIPITTNPRGYSEGKKLNTIKDGIKALWALFKYRFVD